MKLYSEASSPYSALVRAAIYAKGLDIPIEAPPGGTKSDAYRALSRTGQVPCLILDDGLALPESAVIIDYLDDRFPDRPLKPAGAEARARVALIRRLAEQDLIVPMVELFHALQGGDVAAAKADALAHFVRGLDLIQSYMADEGFIAGPALTAADCVLVPTMMGVVAWAPGLGAPDLLASRPKLAAYVARATQHPALAKVLGELQAALAESGVTLG